MNHSTKCKTILVVEDDPLTRDVLVMALESEGYSVISAVNGKDGLAKLQGMTERCLVLTDVWMQEMDGLELIAKLKQYPNANPVIAMTASPYSVPASARKGVAGVIRKPMDLKDLFRVIHKYCGVPRAATSNPG